MKYKNFKKILKKQRLTEASDDEVGVVVGGESESGICKLCDPHIDEEMTVAEFNDEIMTADNPTGFRHPGCRCELHLDDGSVIESVYSLWG